MQIPRRFPSSPLPIRADTYISLCCLQKMSRVQKRRRYYVKCAMTFQSINEKLINERNVVEIALSSTISAEFRLNFRLDFEAPSSVLSALILSNISFPKYLTYRLIDSRASGSNHASPSIRAESCRASVRVSDTLKCAIKPKFARRTIRPLDFTDFRPARDAEMDTGQVVST